MERIATIAALSTPPGEGAIALIRISGPDARAVLARVFRGPVPASEMQARHAYHGKIFEGAKIIDTALATLFAGPASYTGEDMAEISVHGGILVSTHVLELVYTHGTRAAEPGEFTQRAFLHGKMDLTQAEAVMDVIRASTPRALRAAEEQLEGRLGAEITKIRARLLGVVAHLEAYIDFPEEGIDPHTGRQLLEDVRGVTREVDSLLATADEGRILREGVRLVLCGAPNAGKSSLLNRLLGFERAIVSEIPGTTRDTIEEFASLHGIPFRITDTAGLRDTGDLVEREGVERAKKAIGRADVVVHVIDATVFDPSPVAPGEVVALNKSDLLPPGEIAGHRSKIPGAFPISALTGHGIDDLVNAIVARVSRSSAESPTLAAISARHKACLERARENLLQAVTEMENGAPPEIAAAPLRSALDAVGEVIGAADIEDILGQIFSTFCIGK